MKECPILNTAKIKVLLYAIACFIVLTGTYTTLRYLNARDQKKLLDSEVFSLTGDDWLQPTGQSSWSEGQGNHKYYFV